MRVIASVFDKRGLVAFGKGLVEAGAELFSTGQTKRSLEEAGVSVGSVTEITGFPEILDGRVKTLHPHIHGGLLAVRSNTGHMEEIAAHHIEPIDLVVSNLYPFVETVSRPGVGLEEALENIDIGGPTLIRASAKNFPSVLVVVDPDDYGWVLERLQSGGVSMEERQRLAQKAFQHVALYDTAVATYLRADDGPPAQEFTIGLTRLQTLRYGENPHQQSSFYQEVLRGSATIASAKQLHGLELSHNNIVDADSAFGVVRDFKEPAVAVIKHTSPCGLASDDELVVAYQRALAGDPISAFGGIVSFNRTVTMAVAEEVAKTHYDILIAPDYEPEALARLQRKKNMRILTVPMEYGAGRSLDYRRVSGGMLIQTADALEEDPAAWRPTTDRVPTAKEFRDLAFAWKAAKHVKSNAIVLAKDRALIGMGAGQPNRVTSVHLALRAAGERGPGSVLASDALFPFPDGVELAAEGGVTAIAQPGGSVKDEQVIAAANRAGLAMLFTGTRHFKH